MSEGPVYGVVTGPRATRARSDRTVQRTPRESVHPPGAPRRGRVGSPKCRPPVGDNWGSAGRSASGQSRSVSSNWGSNAILTGEHNAARAARPGHLAHRRDAGHSAGTAPLRRVSPIRVATERPTGPPRDPRTRTRPRQAPYRRSALPPGVRAGRAPRVPPPPYPINPVDYLDHLLGESGKRSPGSGPRAIRGSRTRQSPAPGRSARPAAAPRPLQWSPRSAFGTPPDRADPQPGDGGRSRIRTRRSACKLLQAGGLAARRV